MHLMGLGDWGPLGLARTPDPHAPYPMLAVDLTDANDCQRKLTQLQGITHVLYAARFSRADSDLRLPRVRGAGSYIVLGVRRGGVLLRQEAHAEAQGGARERVRGAVRVEWSVCGGGTVGRRAVAQARGGTDAGVRGGRDDEERVELFRSLS
jgi:hypothetical protein